MAVKHGVSVEHGRISRARTSGKVGRSVVRRGVVVASKKPAEFSLENNRL